MNEDEGLISRTYINNMKWFNDHVRKLANAFDRKHIIIIIYSLCAVDIRSFIGGFSSNDL